jgi:transposase
MRTKDGKRRNVYFYSIVLSRSRYKYFQLRIKPFTSKTSIQAQEAAFEYFAGVPKKIIYDQDSVFINDENLGRLNRIKDLEDFI